jgi:hypothetical protein
MAQGLERPEIFLAVDRRNRGAGASVFSQVGVHGDARGAAVAPWDGGIVRVILFADCFQPLAGCLDAARKPVCKRQ